MTEHVSITKSLRRDLDGILQRLKIANAHGTPDTQRSSRERSIATTKLQEAIMWLGMDLKNLKEAGLSNDPNPYPSSYDPASPTVETTDDGLML